MSTTFFSLYREGASPSTHDTKANAVRVGRASASDSFEVYDENNGTLVHAEFPKARHLG